MCCHWRCDGAEQRAEYQTDQPVTPLDRSEKVVRVRCAAFFRGPRHFAIDGRTEPEIEDLTQSLDRHVETDDADRFRAQQQEEDRHRDELQHGRRAISRDAGNESPTADARRMVVGRFPPLDSGGWQHAHRLQDGSGNRWFG